jgi:4-carboxymuconolactone decarboxylase
VWTREGLDRRMRSCITLAVLAALGHEQELALHVRAARRNYPPPPAMTGISLKRCDRLVLCQQFCLVRRSVPG